MKKANKLGFWILGAVALMNLNLYAQQQSPLAQQTDTEAFIKQKTQQNKTHAELSVWSGYMFGGKLDRYKYYYNIKDAVEFGGAASIEMRPNVWAEFMYNYASTSAKYRYDYSDIEHEDVNISYFQLGTQKVLPVHEKVKPFGLASLGAAYFNQSNHDNTWAFAGILGAGVKIYLSEKIGLRFQGRFMVPMYFNGIGLGIGTGGFSGGASFGAYALQGDFSGGLVFRL